MAFAEQNCVYGEGQAEYMPLPANVSAGPERAVTTCWQLSEEDMQELERNGGRIWLQQLTFGEALQPQLVTTAKPEF